MNVWVLVAGLGLVDWLITTIVVESELFRPLRVWLTKREIAAQFRTGSFQFSTAASRRWAKARYLVGCHLCAGTWIGLLLAAAVPPARPFGTGPIHALFAGLLIKAIAHFTLEVVALIKAVADRGRLDPPLYAPGWVTLPASLEER